MSDGHFSSYHPFFKSRQNAFTAWPGTACRPGPGSPGRRNVEEAAALEVVLGAQVGALHGHGDPVAADAARRAEDEALNSSHN
jgi:hypothetical protein